MICQQVNSAKLSQQSTLTDGLTGLPYGPSVRTVRTDRKMEPTWTKNGAKIESSGDKLRANSAKSNFWNTRFYKTKLADLLPKSTPQPRGITIKFKCDFDCTFLTSLARTRRRVLLLASGLWPLASGLASAGRA